jgi:hypothetical protein
VGAVGQGEREDDCDEEPPHRRGLVEGLAESLLVRLNGLDVLLAGAAVAEVAAAAVLLDEVIIARLP